MNEAPAVPAATRPARALLLALVPFSGLAGLTWEVLWQHHASLALGVSAQGTAITLACTMGGMAIGSLTLGRWLRARRPARPLRLYAALELVVGFSGLLLVPGFAWLERVDGSVWSRAPALAPLVHVLGIVLLLAPPT